MCEDGYNILLLDHIQVDFFPAAIRTGKLVFTFTELSNRELTGLGFAGKFAVANGFDLVAIKSNVDDWYQGLPSNTFDLVEQFLNGLPERHTSRAAYGSSMGGYAAILFARDTKADFVLALSPQFDIAQAWDTRWSSHAKKIGSIPVLEQKNVRPGCNYFVVYDPMDQDRLHFDQFAKVIPGDMLHPMKLPYAGHPVGYLLSAVGSLKDVVSAVLNGSTVPVAVGKARTGRETYPDYFSNLARHCLRRRKAGWAKAAISKAISLAPLNAEYRIQAAQIAEAQGNLEDAMSHAALAVALSPSHPHMIATLSRILHRQDLHVQALHYIEAALTLAPNTKSFADQRACIEHSLLSSSLHKI